MSTSLFDIFLLTAV